MDTNEKYEKLKRELIKMGRVAIAFSSGVDSTFLLKVAHEILGDNVLAITVHSCSFPEREFSEASEFCQREHINHIVVDTNELEIEGFSENPPNRCYICKKALFTKMLSEAKNRGFEYLLEGSNVDDLGDYRPGLQAIKELGIISPLKNAGLYKAEIRKLSKELELETWEKPSYACLASRFVYGETITAEKLKMVEKAEELLMSMGYKQMRVRIHGNLARIELLPADIESITEENRRKEIVEEFKKIGFSYISLDLLGYRTGSMNEVLN